MSTNKHHSSALEKEFELERLILFSDAVFAIAITLLVIDIKWPELPENWVPGNAFQVLKPTFASFLAFAISFFFIGRSWSQHLRLCRTLRKYDGGLIMRNLLFLFFIVIFPFAASGIAGHVRPGFLFPLYVYMSNIAAISINHFNLCHYIIRRKPWLTAEGGEAEKKYLYYSSMYIAIAMGTVVFVLIAAGIIFPGKDLFVVWCCTLTAPTLGVAKRLSKKYKPTEHV